ncbi:MAG: beta strand repeat-containing protein [bacterium]
MRYLIATALFVLTLFSMPSVFAGVNVCETQADGDWNNPGTWTNCGGTFPQTGDDVSILHAVSFNQNAQLSSFSISGAGDFDVAAGGYTLTTTSSDIDLSSVDVTLFGSLTLVSTDGNIILGDINGDFDLALNSNFQTIFQGTNTSTTDTSLRSITTDAAGITVIKGIRNFTLSGDTASTFNDGIVLGTSSHIRGQLSFLLTGLGGLIFNNSISESGNREHSLELSSDTSDFRFNAAVAVGNLTTNGTANTIMNGFNITTAAGEYNTGEMVFNTPVIIAEDMTFEVSSLSGNISFANTINDDGDVNTDSDVTVNTDNATTFSGIIGGNNPIASLQTDSTGTTSLYADITVVDAVVLRDVSTSFNALSVNANAIQILNDLAISNGDFTFNCGSVILNTITGVISGSDDFIKAGAGDVEIGSINTLTGDIIINGGSITNTNASENIFPSVSTFSLAAGTQASLSSSTTGIFELTAGQSIVGSGSFSNIVDRLQNVVVDISPGFSPGQLTFDRLYVDENTKLSFELNGTTAGTEYDQIIILTKIDLEYDLENGTSLDVSLGFVPDAGDSFTIIDNQSANTVSGTFINLPEGAIVNVGNYRFSISYVGGDGNDVVLTNASCQTVQDGLWSDANTWTGCDGAIPQATDHVIINHSVSLDVDATILSLDFGPSADFDVAASASGLTLNITASDVDFTGVDIDLFGDFTLNNTNNTIDIGAIDGNFNLVINSSKRVWFRGDHHAINGLKSITTDVGGHTRISLARTFNLTGDVDSVFNDGLKVGASAELIFNQTGNGNIIFNDYVTKFSGSPQRITISNDTGETQINGVVSIGQFTTNGTANVLLSGATITTIQGGANNGNMTFNSPVVVGNDTIFTATNNGTITFNNSLDDDGNASTPSAVTINSPNVTQLSTVGMINPLDSLTTNTNGSNVLNGDIKTLNSTTFNDSITLANAVELSGAIVDLKADVDNAGFDLSFNSSNINGSTGIDGVLSGSGDFISNGNGAIEFSSVNSMTGNLIVNSGTVINKNVSNSIFPGVVDFSLAENTHAYLGGGGTSLDTFELINGQTIKGKGECLCLLDVKSGAIIDPGFSPGNLILSGVKMATGATLKIELNGTDSSTEYDWISSSVTANLDSESSGGATLDVTLGFTPQIGDQFTILQFGAPFVATGTFYGLPEGETFSSGGTIFSITYVGGDGNDVVLTALGPSKLYVDENVAVAGNGTSWTNAFDKLQDALAAAITDTEIWVASGVYYPDTAVDPASTFTVPNGVKLYGGFNGTETNLTQRDPKNNLTILSGDLNDDDTNKVNGITVDYDDLVGTNSYHLLTIANSDESTLIDGFTLTGGWANGMATADQRGSVINCGTGTISLNNLIVQGNRVENKSTLYGCDSITNNSEFLNNFSNGLGTISTSGGIYTDVVIKNNFAFEQGSAFYLESKNLELVRVALMGNSSSEFTGVIRANNGTLNLDNVLFQGNSVGDTGGAMMLQGSLVGLFNNVTITGNRADVLNGGGIKSTISGSLEINNSILWNNQDRNGVGTTSASIDHTGTGTVTIKSSILQGSGGSSAWTPSLLVNGGGNLDIDPLFIANTDPSTAPTLSGNARLQSTSTAVDAGDNSFVTGSTDLDGRSRISNTTVDMGAYEMTSQIVSVDVSGLNGTVVLQNNGADDLTITSNGVHAFSVQLAYASPYQISVLTQPTQPNQICTLNSPSGIIDESDVLVSVSCSVVQYAMQLNVSGLAVGNEFTVNNGIETLQVNQNGVSNFSSLIDDGTAYTISLITQPLSPNQICSTDNDTGQIAGADVTIEINCVINQYFIGGVLSGLASGNDVTLSLGAESLTLSENNIFNFVNPLDDLSSYSATVSQQPTNPNQSCVITNASGTINGDDIVNMDVICTTNEYLIGGTVSGLVPGSELLISNNNSDFLTINNNGGFSFANTVPDTQSYLIEVTQQPRDPFQICQISNFMGTVPGTDVTDIIISCMADLDTLQRDGFE